MAKNDKDILTPMWYRFLPELRHVKSWGELVALGTTFQKRNRTWFVASTLMLFSLMVIGTIGGAKILIGWGLPFWLAAAISLVILSWLPLIGGLFIWYRPYVRFVRRYLHEHGVPVCLSCGSDLQSMAEPRCSKCGRAFERGLMGVKGDLPRAKDPPEIMRWSCWFVPELRHVRSPKEWVEMETTFQKRFRWRFSVFMGVITFAMLLGLRAIERLLAQVLPGYLPIIMAVVICGLVALLGAFCIWYRPYVRFVRQFLYERGVRLCPKCGYDLHGLTEPRCPECGRGVEGAFLNSKPPQCD